MNGESVSKATGEPDIDEERVYRKVLVKSLPPSTSKQDLTIYFQSRKNGGGDIEELRFLDPGTAVLTFKEEKVAKSVQKKKQVFKDVLLTVQQYNVKHREMEDLQVFSKVSAMMDLTTLGLTTQEAQALLQQIKNETNVGFSQPQNKRDVFILTGSFQQIQKCHHLLFENFLSKSAASKRKDTLGSMNGKECHMNGKIERSSVKNEAKGESKKLNDRAKDCRMNGTPEELPSMSNGAKGAHMKLDDRTKSYHMNGSKLPSMNDASKIPATKCTDSAATTSNGFCKTSKETSTSERKSSSNDSRANLKTDPTEKHTVKVSLNPSVKYLSSYGTKDMIIDKTEGNDTKSIGGLTSEVKEKKEDKKESIFPIKKDAVDCTLKVPISNKTWHVFVKMYEGELQSVMANFSVQIEPEDNNSMATIKPTGDYDKERLKMACEELKKLYEEASSKMKAVRFALVDPENKEHDSILRKTVLQIKKDAPVFLERAEDRQSWEIFGETDQVEKGMKFLEEKVKLERKQQDDDRTIEESDSEEESEDADKQSTDTDADDSADDVDEDDGDDSWNEKLEHQLENVKLSVYRGDITEEQCDAIVNAANENLDHGGGVARTIVSKGGPSIQDECDRTVNSTGKLNVGDAAVSHSGKLSCKKIIHAVGPNWRTDKGEKGKALLKKACKESLAKAEKYNFRSIAFPAISSGIFGMPKDICAQVMFDAVEEYNKGVTSSGDFRLRDIRFVNNDAKTVKVFKDEFKTRYGKGKVIPESKRDSKGSGDQSAYTMGNPFIRGNSEPFKMSPTWRAETDKETMVKSKASPIERSSSIDTHSSRQENGPSLLSRGKRSAKPNPSHPAPDKTRIPSHQHNQRGVYPRDRESKSSPHSSKYPVNKSFSFSGGARPKEIQSQNRQDKTHNDHLLIPSTKTEDDINKCSICLGIMKHPKTLPCNHTFCKTCLEKAIQHSPQCPYCRKPLSDRQGSPTHGHGINGYRGDEYGYSGLDRYGDMDDDTTLCLLCTKPAIPAKTLPCRHTFCRACANRALKEYPSCPCCMTLQGNQPSATYWDQDPYDQQFSYSQDRMDVDVPQGAFPPSQGWRDADVQQGPLPPSLLREPVRSNRGNRPPHAPNIGGYQDQFSFPGAATRRGQLGRGVQPEGSMVHRQELFNLPGYEGYGTIVIQYSFRGGVQGTNHPNPGFRYDGTSRSAYLPDCLEGRKVLKLLRKAFDAGLIFRIGRSMTSKLDNQIIWAGITHKTSTRGGPNNYGYPDPTYLSDVKQQLRAALNGR